MSSPTHLGSSLISWFHTVDTEQASGELHILALLLLHAVLVSKDWAVRPRFESPLSCPADLQTSPSASEPVSLSMCFLGNNSCTCLLVGLTFTRGFPCGSTGKECTCKAGDLGLIPGLGRSPGEGKGYPVQCSGLENSMDCVLHGVAKTRSPFLTGYGLGFGTAVACPRGRGQGHRAGL